MGSDDKGGGKFKLSDTLQFLGSKLNALTGTELGLSLEVVGGEIKAGGQLEAKAVIRNPGKQRTIDYLVLTLDGQVQTGEGWRAYTEAAEVAHDKTLPPDQELVIPILLNIPEDAVLTSEGCEWVLRGRVSIDRAVDPRAEVVFRVS
jgi:sporulation-control protein spo0M